MSSYCELVDFHTEDDYRRGRKWFVNNSREGKLVLTIAEKLNFTITLRYPSVADQLKFSRKVSILKDVATGISEIGIGRLRPTNNNMNDTIAISVPYDEECITWGVPRIITWSNDIVLVEFSWEVWVSIGLIFAITCIIAHAHRGNVLPKDGPRTNIGFMTILFDVIVIHLGNPVVHVSSSSAGKFMMTAMVFYAMVITTAYRASLASILATVKGTPTIVDAQGIIDRNLIVGGSLYDYNILQDQMKDSELSSILLERFVINNNDSKSWDQLMLDQNYAFLARRSSLDYDRQMIIKAHESVTFDVLSNCVLGYHTVLAFQNISFLREPSDEVIQRLIESGIMRHWDINEIDVDKILERRVLVKYYDNRAADKFRSILMLYVFCNVVSTLFFLLELAAPKLNPKKQLRTIKIR